MTENTKQDEVVKEPSNCCDHFGKWVEDAFGSAMFAFIFVSLVLGIPASICFKVGICSSIGSVWTTMGWAWEAAGWSFWVATAEHLNRWFKRWRAAHPPTVPTSI
jgi:hypothetical protein